MNKNGRIDPYEDPSQPLEERVSDLISQMTFEETAGLMFQPIAPLNMHFPGRLTASEQISQLGILHLNIIGNGSASEIAKLTNSLQEVAAQSRLGIPVTFSTDPRHAFTSNPGAAMNAGAFSQWPEPIGLGAIGDPALVAEFADIARQEYRAVGIHLALHPMADLATEPRWARISGTFGEDEALASTLTAAYVRGFQGEALGPESVACMTKHFPGGGPQRDGEDPHFPYGREQVYPGGRFAEHMLPFEAAIAAGTAQIMPYYGMPVGIGFEEVGFAFNREIITELLRDALGFDGVVCADWGVLNDGEIFGKVLPARAWGVEDLSIPERVKKALDAGVDQFGGESCPAVIIELVKSGQVSEERIDVSVRRLLRDKFRLGLFENPFVDPEAAEGIVGNKLFIAAGEHAQRASIVLLKNGETPNGTRLPIAGRPKLYLENVDPAVAAVYGEVVAEIAAADLALIRLSTPFEPRDRYPLEAFFHAGDLSFPSDEVNRILEILETAPTVFDIFLERSAVIPEIAVASVALTGSFGASDAAWLDVVFGRFAPVGRLPFELPSSMDAVRNQKPDAPHDSEEPLFPFGHGLRYES